MTARQERAVTGALWVLNIAMQLLLIARNL